MKPIHEARANKATEPLDMSLDAIWRRLRLVDDINDLCGYLSGFTPVTETGSRDQEGHVPEPSAE